jgi:hypothetical protein
LHTAALSGGDQGSAKLHSTVVERPEAAELLADLWVTRQDAKGAVVDDANNKPLSSTASSGTKVRRVRVKRKVKVRG